MSDANTANPPELAEILAGCRANDRRSQHCLYRLYYPYAMSVCLRYAKDREDAVEIMNDAYLSVLRSLDRYQTGKPFRPWFRRVLVNKAIDHHRARHRHPLTVELTPTLAEEQVEDPAVDSGVDVLPLLWRLPPAYRIVFNLYVMEGYKHREIALRLGISINTSKSNLSRAKVALRRLLDERGLQQAGDAHG